MIRTLLCDDEPLARELTRSMLAAEPDVVVVGEAGDGAAAVRAIGELAPDLVLLDVQMPELDGFEVLRRVEVMPVVVFVTAHDRFAIRAFEVHALDYLLKPFDEARLAVAIQRVREKLERRDPPDRILALLEQLRAGYPDRLAVRDGGRVSLVPVSSIDWIGAAGKYVALHTGDTEHLMRGPIGAVEQRLDPRRFLRIHRSTIVDLDRVVAVETSASGDPVLVLEGGTRLAGGRGYRERIAAWLARS